MNKRAMLLLALSASSLLTGCAMSPEQQDNFRNNFMQGLGATQRPVYQAPAYQPAPIQPTTNTTCRRNAWDGSVNCTSW